MTETDAKLVEVVPCVDASGHRTSWDICYSSEPGATGCGVIASCYGTREQADTMARALTAKADTVLLWETLERIAETHGKTAAQTMRAKARDAIDHLSTSSVKQVIDGWEDVEPELGAETAEPPLREIIYGYYSRHFDADRSATLTAAYIEAIDAALRGARP